MTTDRARAYGRAMATLDPLRPAKGLELPAAA